jgi:hypothetical protein
MAKVSKRAAPKRSSKKVRPARGAGPRRFSAPTRPTTPANSYTSKPVSIAFADPASHRYQWADLEIHGIDHSQSSYEGRVFFDNPGANADTPRTLEHGYAGSFYIFGHGGCFGDVGHCEIHAKRDSFDFRDPHPLLPTKARIAVTTALRQMARSKQEITITVVPIVSAANDLCDTKDVFRFKRMRFLTYNG